MSLQAKITKGDSSEDPIPTESALLGPDNPTNAGGRGQDKQGEALGIPEKAEVGEKMINKPGVAVKRGFSATRQKMAYEPIGGKKRHHQELPQGELQVWRLRKQRKKSKKGQHHC